MLNIKLWVEILFLILFLGIIVMNIYVGNLPNDIDETELTNVFQEYGKVFSVKLISDRETGQFRGFGFVEMDQNGGNKAIKELNEKELNGRNIVVNEARPKTDRPRNFNRRY